MAYVARATFRRSLRFIRSLQKTRNGHVKFTVLVGCIVFPQDHCVLFWALTEKMFCLFSPNLGLVLMTLRKGP